MLEDGLLDSYINSFYGYGSYTGSTWFVGMEEGSLGGLKEISDRLMFWDNCKRAELIDFAEMCKATDSVQWIGADAKIQATWRYLIRLLLALKSDDFTTADVRQYQGLRLGRIGLDNCVMELMPLPCKAANAGNWHYNRWSSLPYLCSRTVYIEKVLPLRIKQISERIQRHSPRLVIFYGKTYVQHWQSIARCTFDKIDNFDFGRKGDTYFCITPHPVAIGTNNAMFDEAGRELRRRMQRVTYDL